MGRNPPSLKLRQNNGAAIHRKESKKDKKAIQQTGTVRKKEKEVANMVYPEGDTAFKALLSARFCSAIWSYISDCDETYNFWEPMHYLVFGKGLQTWEYSPEFALRSYTYLMVHATPAYIYHKLLQPNPLLIFYLIRCVLGLLCAISEVFFYKAVCREFGVHIGRLCLVFQLFSAGMFISSTAFLPSTFAMYTVTASMAAWWYQQYELAVFLTALGSLLGWPFAAILGLPLAFDMIVGRKLWKEFVQWSFISAIVILGPMIMIDSVYYGKLLVAPWNIIKYNIFGGGGPNLYGTEPFTFYLINGFLNFNFVWLLSLVCPVFLILQSVFIPSKYKLTMNLPYYVSLSPLYLWLLIFMLQPHKEERFLFPVYPLICLTGAISLDVIQKLYYRVSSVLRNIPKSTHYVDLSLALMSIVIVIVSALGISRIVSLYNNYHAPLDLLMELRRYPAEGRINNNAIVNVCLGKEWHRYPSSFFLPNENWNVRFVQSEFKGILPAPYTENSNGTVLIHKHFNDKNKEEPSLYFNITKCHFMLDLDLGRETDLEPLYANMKDKWKVVKWLPFLNAEKSDKFYRAFYVPFLTQRYVQYGNYTLLQTIKTKSKS